MHGGFTIMLLLIAPFVMQAQNTPAFTITVDNINTLGKYRPMVSNAVALINEVLNSDEFKAEVVNHKYDWQRLPDFGKPEMKNDEVFRYLYRTTAQYHCTLFVRKMGLQDIKFWTSGTVGVTSINQHSTLTFSKKWMNLSTGQYLCTVITYAAHIAHEYCHQVGFADKDDNHPQNFRDVVPYAIGDIMCKLLQKKFNLQNCACDE